MRMRPIVAILSSCVFFAGCRSEPRDAHHRPGADSSLASDSSATEDEPPDEVVERLQFEEYAEIEKAGGLPVQITATGQNLVLHPKLYSARKDSCRRLHQNIGGGYECHLTITLSLDPDGRDPSQQGSRMFLHRTENGEWERGLRPRKRSRDDK